MTFDAMETIERNSNSTDKLTSFVSKMNMKMDKHEIQYKPQVYQGRNRGQNRHRQDNYQSRNRSYSRDRNHIEAEETTTGTIDQIIEVDHETTIDVTIGETTINIMIGER